MANIATPRGFSTPRNILAGNVSPAKALGAEFFAVASGVQVPYVGGDVRDETIKIPHLDRPSTLYSEGEYIPTRLAHNSVVSTAAPQADKRRPESPHEDNLEKLLNVLSQHPHTTTDRSTKSLSKKYLQQISDGMLFTDDVVHSRAPHTVPYKESDALYRPGGLVHVKAKSTGPVGRHDTRGTIKKHMPCHLKGPRKLKPLTRSQSESKEGRKIVIKRASSFEDISTKNQGISAQTSKDSMQHEWDEHCLGSLSKSTAEWIVKEHLSGTEKERLGSFLKKRYYSAETEKEAKTDKTYSRKDSRAKSKSQEKAKEKKSEVTDLSYTPSFALPSRVGDKKLETQNIYQLELLSGAQPVPPKMSSEKDTIVLESNDKVKFMKHLQDNFPQGNKLWYPGHTKQKKKSVAPQVSRQTKGLQRWKYLPSVVQDDVNFPTAKISSHSDLDIAALSAGYRQRKKIKEDLNVVKIAEEWRSKWFLERKWQSCSTEELIQGMSDINDHVRLAAVAACSKAALIRKEKKDAPKLQGIILEKAKVEADLPLQAALEPELVDKIITLLQDSNWQVRIAAAITLFTLNKPSQEAEDVLLWAIGNGGGPEKWAATQCLALAGMVCDRVINELVNQLHSDNAIRVIEAGALLAELSQFSGIVQSLIAELLNSNSWKDRVTACKVIPKLKGGINKDMMQKLSYLMWNDWSKEVRTTAAQALGKTGNGKVSINPRQLVHDTLRERILMGNERSQVDALKKLSNLGIMTVRLLPALLDCFKSEYVSVRIEAAMAAGQLRITDEKALEGLVDIAGNDRSWKVKAHAIKAIGCVGIVTEQVIDVLLWAIRYEKVPAVRAEACNAVAALRIKDERILSVLQDRLVVETDDLVKREAIFTLQTLGVEPTGDLEMIEAIRSEVRRLCTKDTVVAHILEEDNTHAYTTDYKRLFTTAEDEPVPEQPATLSREQTMVSRASRASRAASQASQRGWDPILAGYQAREIMSRAPTPGDLHMEHSYLPMDLNSASSENSSVIALSDDVLSDEEEDDVRLTHSTQFEIPTLGSSETESKLKTASMGQLDGVPAIEEKREHLLTPTSQQPRPQSDRSSVAQSETAQLDLCSEPESSKDDAELMKLAQDDGSDEQSMSVYEPSELQSSHGDTAEEEL